MNRKSLTKDELFLVKLYQMALALGSPYEEVDRYVIGRAIGQNDKGVDTIARLLAQANFVKKGDGTAVFLTDNGLKLAQSLQN